MCGLVFVNLDPGDIPSPSCVGDLPAAARALRHPVAGPVQRWPGPHPERQLEGRRRQLPRGLSRADRPPGPDAAARLRALHPGYCRGLRLVRGADAGRAIGEPHRAPLPDGWCADGEADRGRPPRLALPLHLSEHGDRPLCRPGRAGGRSIPMAGAHARRVRAASPPRGGRSRPPHPPAQRSRQRPRRRRGRGACGGGAEWPENDRLPLRPAERAGGRGGLVRVQGPDRPRRRERIHERTPLRRARADPRSGGGADRQRGHRRCPHRADRVDAGVSPALVHYHFDSRETSWPRR